MESRADEDASSRQGPPPPRKYLTKQELAERSGLSASTIQRYKDRQRLPFYQPGGKGARVLFPLDAIEAAAAQTRQDRQDALDRAAGTGATASPPGRPKLPGPRPRWQSDTNPT